MITIKSIDDKHSRAEIKIEKGTNYHEMLLGAEMLIEVLVKDRGNNIEDVLSDIKYIYDRDNKEDK